MTIEEYFGDWMKVIDKQELIKVVNKLKIMSKFTPAFPLVFKAFELCKYNDLKVVMLGLDPYPQKNVATGILFGNNKDVSEENLSPSLKIVKEAVIDFEIPHNSIIFDQTLESWATTRTKTNIGAIALSAPTKISPKTVTKDALGTNNPKTTPITKPTAIRKIRGTFV